MTFADDLKAAGTSKTAVLHEFLTHHDPKEERVHAFVEGYDDPVFYREALARHAGNRKIYFYTCDGKARLYQVYQDVAARVGPYRHILFFSDKDLEDIIPEFYPKDDRIYVTDYYSIENYIVCWEAIERSCSDFVKVKHCGLPVDMVSDRFDKELHKFHVLSVSIMAWIVCVRRAGLQANLNNIDLKHIFAIDDSLHISRRHGILAYLCKVTSVPVKSIDWRSLRSTMRELQTMNAKRFVRGKFEIWFLVQYLKKAIEHLTTAAQGQGGSLDVLVRISLTNVVALLAPRLPCPTSVDAFLSKHLGLF